MFRSYLIAAGAALLCTTASAQQKLDPSRMFPITTPVKNAGTVDVTTGKWTKPDQQVKNGSQTIFNNTCTWVTTNYYAGFDWCEENYDEGRIPSPSDPNAPCGAQVNNTITSIQVSYCTFAGPQVVAGGYDMDLAFFNKLNGDCVGGIAPTPPPVSTTATAYIPLAGLGLPGSTAIGFQSCWLVTLNMTNTGMVLASDGEGTFNGIGADDKFTWMQRQNVTVGALNGIAAGPDGFFISGEPATGGFGACSYDIPCGIDALFGNTCGTGLDVFDNSWINVDGIGVGASNQPAGCVNNVAQYGAGTNCYFFGGYPTNPWASYWLVLESDHREVCGAVKYCFQTKATTVANCTADFSVNDLTLATGTWNTTNIPSATAGPTLGIYIYTTGIGIGQSAVSVNVPFGTLCLAQFKRSSPTCAPANVPTAANVCNAVNLTVAPNCNSGALGIVVGSDVNAQCWYRDPGAVGNANFSNACFYTVQ